MKLILKYLLLLRILAIGGQLFALAAMHWGLGMPLPWAPVAIVFSAMLLLTGWSWRKMRRDYDIRQREFMLQLLADIAALTVLIYFTGGAVNPFISLFILPIVFAAAAMPRRHTAAIATCTVLCYTGLMFFHVPFANGHLHISGVDLHIWGMWYGFLVSAACVAVFVARISSALRERDSALASAREAALQAERAIALGTLAAGTAHELGTPLATMAVLAQDLETDLSGDERLRQPVALLRQQISRCKSILSQLAIGVGAVPADAGNCESVADFMEDLMADWRQLRPGIELRYLANGASGIPDIIADRTVRQAILNVLNNSADASATVIEVVAAWNQELITVEVKDDGTGIAAPILDRIGRETVTTKCEGEGLGIGLYLAHIAVQRLGGRVELNNLREGGTRARIELPLAPLRAAR